MYFNEAKAFAQKYRSEISPIMNKMGFKVSVTTYKEYYSEGKVIVKVVKVPKDFPVWSSEYSRYDFTPQAEKIVTAITKRLEVLRQTENEEWDDLEYEIMFDRKIPYINFNKEEN
jgi:hypothetical protein|tara:strand:+ start:270 stop:614 length:345 start_codon:yes stop_codon:yes gene_type:complete